MRETALHKKLVTSETPLPHSPFAVLRVRVSLSPLGWGGVVGTIHATRAE